MLGMTGCDGKSRKIFYGLAFLAKGYGMRVKADYSVWPRTMPSGNIVYYYRTYDEFHFL
jgi:hypothetical protein